MNKYRVFTDYQCLSRFYSDCYLVKKLDKNEECVAKIISLGRKIAEYGPEMILKLQTLLMSLSHPNILKTISIPIQNEQVCVVEELFVLFFPTIYVAFM